MRNEPQVQCYLAGPDVFYPDAVARGERKKQHLATLGISGHFPFDNEVPQEQFAGNGAAASRTIAEENEAMMERCLANGDIGVILINMTPWRGPEMDSGTAFEAGYFSALRRMGKPVVLVGYYEEPTPGFFERTSLWCERHLGEAPHRDAHGTWRDYNDHALERFGDNADNLMIDEAIRRAGGKVCHSFEEAASLAKQLSDQMKEQMKHGPAVKPLHDVTVTGKLEGQEKAPGVA